jgi:hypothetical protein
MKYEVYADIKSTPDFDMFDFVSIGKNGAIPKRVVFQKTRINNVYHMVFGDVDDNGEIDYYSVSDNGDRNKILATVVKTVEDYTQRYPDRWIAFTGSTIARTRLYRMAVELYHKELSAKFDVYAYVENKIVPFVKGLNISAFLIKRKIV